MKLQISKQIQSKQEKHNDKKQTNNKNESYIG